MLDLFVYGTLRPGEALHHLIEDSVLHSEPFTMYAAELHYHVCNEYPVLRTSSALSNVDGDVCTLLATNAVRDVLAMEVLAGYDARWVVVNGREVLAFFWPEHLPVGAHIPSGDWRNR